MFWIFPVAKVEFMIFGETICTGGTLTKGLNLDQGGTLTKRISSFLR